MAKIVIPESMKNNYFYIHRKEVAASCEQGDDLDVGLMKFAAKTGTRDKVGELNAFRDLIFKYIKSKDQNVSELFK